VIRLRRSDRLFPERLRAIFDPPESLYVRGVGDLEFLARRAVAVVGARSCSPYGAQVARMLGRELAAAGLVVVSGLARGIDGEAHRGVLDAGGITVAVLGCGIDRDYPVSNAQLSRRIEETGLVVSEYEPGVEPAPWRFPARNRVIAGLCEAVVVVEARERSGALITADFAVDEGREVFAVPGEITAALSMGTNALLKLGATPLTSAQDVLDALGIEPPAAAAQTANVSPSAAQVLELVREAPAGADELTARGVLDAGAISVALTELELAGLVAGADGIYRPTR
jgi:DNA processing protein